ncbi:MAG: response regulator transcription factor, partial [Gammaproteobacteria bacterium]|nr:response regulator transcription factor [Gammaproteobacteria bacterium]
MRIGILEDDIHLGQLMQLWVAAAGHDCERYTTGEAIIEALEKKEQFDLLVLDWMLPGISGDKVLDWVRSNVGWEVPVIFITQKDSQEDIVSALERGADDYMIKPVTQMEMLARLTALGRRRRNAQVDELKLQREPFTLDMESHTLLRHGEIIPLTQKEFDLSTYLFNNVGQVLSRSNILETVWGRNPNLNTRTVDIHISRLRKKLGLNGESGWRLIGIYNHGYR